QAYPSNLTYNPPAYPDTSITKPPQNNEDYSLLGEDTPGHNDATPSAPDFVLPSVPTNNNNNDDDTKLDEDWQKALSYKPNYKPIKNPLTIQGIKPLGQSTVPDLFVSSNNNDSSITTTLTPT
ncbi:hypothetical protein, partial [Salmonella sp. s54836]|uniref:hypothetical protein n=1 Tax=Salmonella sp. s54836 TaxID=3159673 RepID=UPI0039807601